MADRGTTGSSALHLLHRAGQRADEIFAESIGKSDLTPRQFAVLKAVSETEEPSQTTLVEMTGIDRSTLADIVRRLVDRRLLQRKRTKHDARMYAVRLTAAGQNALRNAEPAARKTDDRLLAGLSSNERDNFVKLLGRVVSQMHDGGAAPRGRSNGR
jgi:DNA-binding MarR family transcriptional regulator